MDTKPTTWRNEPQLRGLQASVQSAINGCLDGAYVTLDIGTSYALIDALKQAVMSDVLAMLIAQTEGKGLGLVTIRALIEEAAELGARRALAMNTTTRGTAKGNLPVSEE